MSKSIPILMVASSNAGKVRELREFLQGLSVEVAMLPNAEKLLQGAESEDDYEANAIAKARRAAELSGVMALGEDSGLEVEYLGGAPGPLSARFISANASAGQKNQALLAKLKGVPEGKRAARFVSVIAIAEPNGEIHVFRGECLGTIAVETAGEHGFGYDPLFIPDRYDKTFGELGADIKNRISHRALAMAKVREYLASKQ